jgi:hypothetical protein
MRMNDVMIRYQEGLKTHENAKGGSLLSEQDLEGLRVFATTVLRGSRDRELTGYLLELDWRRNAIERQIPIPVKSSHPFWNARGGNRGGRGLFVHRGILYVATALTIYQYDSNLQLVGEIAHPWLAGLHEIFIDEEGIWATSTVHDLVFKLDFQGNIVDEWFGSESEVLQQFFGYSGRQLNLSLEFHPETFTAEYEQYCADERLHVNTVWSYEGVVFVLACRKNALIRIRPLPEQVVVLDEKLSSPHNGILTEDGEVLINDTQNQRLCLYSLDDGRARCTIDTSIYKGGSGFSQQFSTPGWQRGLAHVKNSVYLVGTSPASVFEVDIRSGVIGRICQIDDDINHCIHGLTATYNL